MREFFKNKPGLIIIGERCSGKTKLAEFIKSRLRDNETLTFIGSKGKINFKYKADHVPLKLIVIDDIVEPKLIKDFSSIVKDGISVEIPKNDPVKIYPKLVITCDEEITMEKLKKSLGVDLEIYFDVVTTLEDRIDLYNAACSNTTRRNLLS